MKNIRYLVLILVLFSYGFVFTPYGNHPRVYPSVPDDIPYCWGDQNDFCYTYDDILKTLVLVTNESFDTELDMVNTGDGNFVLKQNGNKILDESNTVAVTGRGPITVIGTDTPALSYGTQTYTKASSGILSVLECSGGVIYATGAATLTAVPVFPGMDFWVHTEGTIAVSVAPNLVDKIWLDGIVLHDDDKIDNTSTAGDWVHCTDRYPDGLWCITNGKNWTDGGAGGGAIDYTQDANCMGAWRMSSSNNETDYSGEGGTLLESGGDVPTSVTVPAGYSGTSRDFEADNDIVLYHADSLSTDISGANQDISICAWVKLEVAASFEDIVSKYTSTLDQRSYMLAFDTTSSGVRFQLSGNGTNFVYAIGATDIGTNWAHCCGVYNDTDIRVYIDGVLDANGADNPKAYTAGLFNSSSPFEVGNNNDLSWELDGLIDEVIVFDRALTAGEVNDIYTDGMDGTKGGND